MIVFKHLAFCVHPEVICLLEDFVQPRSKKLRVEGLLTAIPQTIRVITAGHIPGTQESEPARKSTARARKIV